MSIFTIFEIIGQKVGMVCSPRLGIYKSTYIFINSAHLHDESTGHLGTHSENNNVTDGILGKLNEGLWTW